jgi:anti-sigma regulatory factor (Ser/Thr protein kinase)
VKPWHWITRRLRHLREHVAQLVLPARLEYVREARRLAKSWTAARKLPEGTQDVFTTAATELTANAADHVGTGQITLTCYEEDGMLCCEVEDQGNGFCLESAIQNGERIVSTITSGNIENLPMEDAERHKGLYLMSCTGELTQPVNGAGCVMRFRMKGEQTK